MAGPLGRSIAETSYADTPGQPSFDGRLHQPRCEERQRNRHIDLANAALFTRSNLLDTDGTGNDLKKPTPAARDRCDKCGARLSADRASVLWRCRLGHDDFAPPFCRWFLPGHTENNAIRLAAIVTWWRPVSAAERLSLLWLPELIA